jgi:LuxR family transcriptional regulator, maltose regulon positive regulatory protein
LDDEMSESRTSPPGRSEILERGELLATKFTIPPIRSAWLARSRLVDALNEAMDRELILVCTPAGFGKTTLLADWAQGAKWPVAWLCLDPQDSDPTRFWRYVVAALDRAGVSVGDRVLSLVEGSSATSSRGLVTALINELEGLPDEFALVLDDYHMIESRSVHEDLTYLLTHAPAQLHLIVSTRSDPPLPLSRFRARNKLAELRTADLRFTPEESAAFLREVWGLDLPPEALAALDTRTEGWAVGLQLAALSLRERPDPDEFLAAFTGSHRYVLDYLSEEVLEQQRDSVRSFLLQSSILERLSGPLCDAVTGRSDGQAMLEELERANLFLVPLDEERRWYRFHNLFGDLLRVRLQLGEAGPVPELHQRAAAWFEQHELIDEAIRHASAAGDVPWAARLVERHLDGILRRGEGVVLERWLSVLPDDVVRSNPALCLAQGLMQLHVGELDRVERLVEEAERAYVHAPERRELVVPTEGGMVSEVPAAVSLVRAEIAAARGDADESAEHARSALVHMGEEEYGPQFWARWLLSCADWTAGRLKAAESGFTELLAEGRAAPAAYPLMSSSYALGQVQRAEGKLGGALRTYREGLHFTKKDGTLSTFHAAEAHIGMAQVLYERNQLEDALQHVTEGIELSRPVVEFHLPSVGLVTLAWIRQAMGEANRALETMNQADDTESSTDIASLANPAPAERARLLLLQGQPEDAAKWAEERGLTDQDEVSYSRERDYLVLARVLLASGDPHRALGILERLDALAESQARKGSLIQIRAVRSQALQSVGDHRAALALLAETLALARPEGYVRVFADQGAPMAALLQSLVRGAHRDAGAAMPTRARRHLNRVVRAFEPAVRRAEKAVRVHAGTVEPLTDRELEVLRLIAAGKRNREIARDLVVTLDTAKKHVSHIFAKLGAANRTEAVAQARDLGVIP